MQPGDINGRHYSSYWEEVQTLKARGQTEQLKQLLLAICEAVEAEAHSEQIPVAPAVYRELALLYRKQRQTEKEIAILQRYIRVAGRHAQSELKERLVKAKARLRTKVKA